MESPVEMVIGQRAVDGEYGIHVPGSVGVAAETVPVAITPIIQKVRNKTAGIFIRIAPFMIGDV